MHWQAAVLVLAAGRLSEEKFLRSIPPHLSAGAPQPMDAPEYISNGCYARTTFEGKVVYEGSPMGMTPDKCFNWCLEKPWVDYMGRYFGLEGGSECWCAAMYDGAEAPGKCTSDCNGGGSGCGGDTAADVYHIYDRNTTDAQYHHDKATIETVEEVAPEFSATAPGESAKATSKLPSSIMHVDLNGDGVFDGDEIRRAFDSRFHVLFAAKKCGKDDPVEIMGRASIVAAIADCQISCSMSPQCGGFTYDKSMTRCEFYGDPTAGEAEVAPLADCYERNIR